MIEEEEQLLGNLSSLSTAHQCDRMVSKCLLSFGSDNFVLLLQGSSFDHFTAALSAHRVLSKCLDQHQNQTELVYEIFDQDFETYVRLDECQQINNLSRIRIRDRKLMSFRPIASPKLHPHSSPERGSGSSLGSFVDIQKVTAVYGDATSAGGKQPSGRRVLYDDETTVSVVIPVAPNLVMDQTSDDENSGHISDYRGDTMTIQEATSPPAAPSLDVDWSARSTIELLNCCHKFQSELTRDHWKKPTWDKIAQNLLKKGYFFSPDQCEHKFTRMRSTYINILCYSDIMSKAQWPYLEAMRNLLGEPPFEQHKKGYLIQTANGKKERHPKEMSAAYLTLIQLVRKYINVLANPQEKKNEVWSRISQEMEESGYDLKAKNCQGLFHRLRYHYLHLLKTIGDEEAAQQRWPYFNLFQDIDLRPFKTKAAKRRPRGSEGTSNTKELNLVSGADGRDGAIFTIHDEDEFNEEFDEHDEDVTELTNYTSKRTKTDF